MTTDAKHIATAPIYGGFTGHRVGTKYLYSVREIQAYQDHCYQLYGKTPSIRWRNDAVKKEALASHCAIETCGGGTCQRLRK